NWWRWFASTRSARPGATNVRTDRSRQSNRARPHRWCQRVQWREQMSLVPSLLQAIVRVDGEALVMHAGDRPYGVSPTGQGELANRGLSIEAVNGILAQLLPA